MKNEEIKDIKNLNQGCKNEKWGRLGMLHGKNGVKNRKERS
jgi:hypothetical protein